MNRTPFASGMQQNAPWNTSTGGTSQFATVQPTMNFNKPLWGNTSTMQTGFNPQGTMNFNPGG
jgi:hypothetical protein